MSKVNKAEVEATIFRLRQARVPNKEIAKAVGLSLAQTNFYISMFGLTRGAIQKCPHCGLAPSEQMSDPL